jgi:hypothetical protein
MKKIYFLSLALLAGISLKAQNLVYRTHFNNGLAQDVSGNNHHGVVSGNPTAAAGYSGLPNSALHFDGIDDKVTLPAHSDFNLNKWTLQALVKAEDFYAGQCQVSSIIYHGRLYQSQHYSLRICDNWYDNACGTNTNMEAFDTQPAGSSLTTFQSSYYDSGYVQQNRWYCLTGTYDGDTVKLYVDGDLIVASQWTDQYNYTTTESCYLGWAPEPGFPYWFTGIMDEISIWDDVVTFDAQNPGLCDTFDAAAVRNIVANNNHVRVYPSPATAELNVELSSEWTGATIYIMNGVGQVVAAQKAVSSTTAINIQHLSSGIYMTKVLKDGQMIVEKFVKQ